jgi:hypothetical protein
LAVAQRNTRSYVRTMASGADTYVIENEIISLSLSSRVAAGVLGEGYWVLVRVGEELLVLWIRVGRLRRTLRVPPAPCER